MPRVTRKRTIEAPVADVWKLVSDPYSLPRWWPRTGRVENVEQKPGGRRSQWTKVLQTAEGRGVRADFRCVSSATEERYVWEQQLDGTPFERILTDALVGAEDRGISDEQAAEHLKAGVRRYWQQAKRAGRPVSSAGDADAAQLATPEETERLRQLDIVRHSAAGGRSPAQGNRS